VLNYQIEVSVHAAAVKGALQMTANLFALLVAKNGMARCSQSELVPSQT
jgi:hypothetical protein